MPTKTDDAPWLAQGEDKRAFVREMFADVAPSYDLVNSVMCLRLHHRWRAEAVKAIDLKVGDSALDVCCGTGDFLAPLRRAVGERGFVAGLDFCPPMLAKAREKFPDADLLVGDAGSIPMKDGVFDGATVGWGLRNVPDVPRALSEIARVLKHGGRLVTLDMARPRAPLIGRFSEATCHTVVPWIGRLFGKSKAYAYLPKSTLGFLGREQMKTAMENAGFQDVRWRDFFFGNVCMHWGTKA